MQEILEKYQIRKSNKQKTDFIIYLTNRLKDIGYSDKDIHIEKRWKWIFKTRNVVVGNPETAKIILGAHYDTCAISPLPNMMFPMNMILSLLYQFLFSFIIIGVGLLVEFFVGWMAFAKGWFDISGEGLIYAFQWTVTLIVVQIMIGFRNPHTANDNTSGTLTLIKTLEKISPEDRKNVCVVFFDNEEKGLFGSLFFKKAHQKVAKTIPMINIDCIGDGTDICLLSKNKSRKMKEYNCIIASFKNISEKYNNLNFVNGRLYPMACSSDQANFKKGMALCATRKGLFGIHYASRIHTPLDTICKQENIEAASDFLTDICTKI